MFGPISVLTELMNALRDEIHISHSATKNVASKYFNFVTLKNVDMNRLMQKIYWLIRQLFIVDRLPYYKRGHSANMSIREETEILDKGFLTVGAAALSTVLQIWGKGKDKQGCKDISLQSNKSKTK